MESGPFFWMGLLSVGVAILGVALAFGIIRNRDRTPSEKAQTEAATKRIYAAEDKDHS